MNYTVDDVIEDIQKALDEAEKYHYNNFIVKQDLKNILQEFERQARQDGYDEAMEDVESSEKNYGY